MDGAREKLVELVHDGESQCSKHLCRECQHFSKLAKCKANMISDYLIANGVTVQEWISVDDERKPKDRKHYFIAYVFGDSDMHFFGEAMYHAYEGNDIVDRPHFSNEGVNEMRVTHWMEIPKLPLPEPPKGE